MKTWSICLMVLFHNFVSGQTPKEIPPIHPDSLLVTPKSVDDTIQGEIYTVIDENAEYPGGISQLMRYIKDSISFPEELLTDFLGSKIYVQFVVLKSGKVVNVRLIKSITDIPEFNAYLIEQFESMPNWIPAKLEGKPVNSYYNFPVTICFTNQ